MSKSVNPEAAEGQEPVERDLSALVARDDAERPSRRPRQPVQVPGAVPHTVAS
jgi:hypothetical protein